MYSVATLLISRRPDQDVYTNGIGEDIDLELVDAVEVRRRQLILAGVDVVVVRLQDGLPAGEQDLDEVLDLL